MCQVLDKMQARNCPQDAYNLVRKASQLTSGNIVLGQRGYKAWGECNVGPRKSMGTWHKACENQRFGYSMEVEEQGGGVDWKDIETLDILGLILEAYMNLKI